jgi:hypothetical protein
VTTAPSDTGRPSLHGGRPERVGRRRYLLTAAFTILGALLFIYILRRTGLAEIVDGIRRVGWGLSVILVLAGLRLAARAGAWLFCMPPGTRLSFGRAFHAFLAGDTVGTITPFGLLASEPTKVFLTRHHLATRESVASLAAENLLYTASVAAMVGLGLIVVLVTVPLPPVWRWSIAGAVVALASTAAIGWRLMQGTWDDSRGTRPLWREKVATARQAITGFASMHPARLWQAFALDAVFHVLAVIEVFLTLRWLLGDPSGAATGVRPTLAQAVVFESVNRVIIVAFKFVPFRMGVDEALTGALAPFLSVNPAAGVALAVIRKVRSLFWAGVGLIVIAAHPTEQAVAGRR